MAVSCSRPPWLQLVLAGGAAAQRLDVDACADHQHGEECSFAGALNTVRHGKCAVVGQANHNRTVCIPLAGQADDGGFDPNCLEGRLHSRSRVCCPRECLDCIAGDNDVPDSCSVDFILRLGARCELSAPPCVVSRTQGVSPSGFLVSRTSGNSAAAISTPTSSNPQVSGSTDTSAPAIGDLEGPKAAVLIVSAISMCACCWCWLLLCRSLRASMEVPPIPVPTNSESTPAKQNGKHAKKEKKKRKKKRQNKQEYIEADEEADEKEEKEKKDVEQPQEVDDLRLFAESAVPVPIVDIWQDSPAPVPIVDIWQDSPAPVPIVDIWRDSPAPTAGFGDADVGRGARSAKSGERTVASGDREVREAQPIVDIWKNDARVEAPTPSMIGAGDAQIPERHQAKKKRGDSKKVEEEQQKARRDNSKRETSAQDLRALQHAAAPPPLHFDGRTAADERCATPETRAAPARSNSPVRERVPDRSQPRNSTQARNEAEDFNAGSSSEEEVDTSALASLGSMIGQLRSEQLRDVTPRTSGSARQDTSARKAPVVAEGMSEKPAPAGRGHATEKLLVTPKDSTWHSKWDDMQADLTSALDDIGPSVPSVAPRR